MTMPSGVEPGGIFLCADDQPGSRLRVAAVLVVRLVVTGGFGAILAWTGRPGVEVILALFVAADFFDAVFLPYVQTLQE